MPLSAPSSSKFLLPGRFVDSDDPKVCSFAKDNCDMTADAKSKAIDLYYAVRDNFYYNPYVIDLRPEGLKASSLLAKSTGYCIEKACLLTAAARAAGIPAGIGFARVINHINTEKLVKVLKTNLLVFHGYTVLKIEGKWVKATPAFNKELCNKLQVAALEFDGINDSLFQEYDAKKGRFMEYVFDYGEFHDIPYALLLDELKKYYPHIFSADPGKLLLHLDR